MDFEGERASETRSCRSSHARTVRATVHEASIRVRHGRATDSGNSTSAARSNHFANEIAAGFQVENDRGGVR